MKKKNAVKAITKYTTILLRAGMIFFFLQGIYAAEVHAQKVKKFSRGVKLLSPLQPEIVKDREGKVKYFRVEWGREFMILAKGPLFFTLLVRGVITGKLPARIKVLVTTERDKTYRSKNLLYLPLDTKVTVPARIGALLTEVTPLLFKVPKGKHIYIFRLSSQEAASGVCKLEIVKNRKKKTEEYLVVKEKLIPGVKPPEAVAKVKSKKERTPIPLEPLVPKRRPQNVTKTKKKETRVAVPLEPLVPGRRTANVTKTKKKEETISLEPLVPERRIAKATKTKKKEDPRVEIPLAPLVSKRKPAKATKTKKNKELRAEIPLVPLVKRKPEKKEEELKKEIPLAPLVPERKPEKEKKKTKKEKVAMVESVERVEIVKREEKIPWLRIAGWGGLIFSGISGGTGIVFGLMSKSNADKIVDKDGDGIWDITYAEAERAQKKAKSQALTANVLYGLAGVSLATSAVLLAIEYDIFKGSADEKFSDFLPATPSVKPNTHGISLGFSTRF